MDVGLTCIFQAVGRHSDHDVYVNDLRLADLAEPLGFDSVWGVEHHFTDYTMSPNVLQYLSYMAGRTNRIKIGSGAVILPWHNPVRVAEEVAMIDTMSRGRFIFGMGRGLGRIEFEGLGVPMSESRERFIESAEMILEALERGYVEYDGEIFTQPRRDLRPPAMGTFRNRAYGAAVSRESLTIMADLGIGILINPQKDWEEVEGDMKHYRTHFEEVHNRPAPSPLVTGWVWCDDDPGRARDKAHEYIGNYYYSVLDHYELAGKHFAEERGYEYYEKVSKGLERVGSDTAAENFLELQIWGTPEQCIDRIMDVRGMVGNDGFNAVFSYGGMSYSESETNMRRFVQHVLPRLKAEPAIQPASLEARA